MRKCGGEEGVVVLFIVDRGTKGAQLALSPIFLVRKVLKRYERQLIWNSPVCWQRRLLACPPEQAR